MTALCPICCSPLDTGYNCPNRWHHAPGLLPGNVTDEDYFETTCPACGGVGEIPQGTAYWDWQDYGGTCLHPVLVKRTAQCSKCAGTGSVKVRMMAR